MPVSNIIGIEAGQKFFLDDSSYLEVISTPGHIKSHLAYLLHCHDGQKVLFSGDIISFKKSNGDLLSLASLNNPLSIYEMEISTLTKLLNMDIDVLFTSHYGSFIGKDLVKNHITEALERIESFKNSVIDELTNQPLNIKNLTERVIRMKHYLSGYSTRKSTIFVILKYLMSKGEVTVDSKTRIFNINHNHS